MARSIANSERFGYLPKILWMKRQCPLCSSVEFKTAEIEPLDGLLGLLGLRAVRCVNCWRRYYWFAKKES